MRIFLMTPVGVVVTTRGRERVNDLLERVCAHVCIERMLVLKEWAGKMVVMNAESYIC